MSSCFKARQTWCSSLGTAGEELCVCNRDAGWIACVVAGFAVERRGHDELERLQEFEEWVSFSDDSVRDLVRLF
jgi:hypothetical protein